MDTRTSQGTKKNRKTKKKNTHPPTHPTPPRVSTPQNRNRPKRACCKSTRTGTSHLMGAGNYRLQTRNIPGNEPVRARDTKRPTPTKITYQVLHRTHAIHRKPTVLYTKQSPTSRRDGIHTQHTKHVNVFGASASADPQWLGRASTTDQPVTGHQRPSGGGGLENLPCPRVPFGPFA